MTIRYRCFICNNDFNVEDMCAHNFDTIGKCRYCSHDTYFTNIAIGYILNNYNLRFGEYPDDLLEIEIIRAKTRFILRNKNPKYVTFKNENMITQVNNSTELRQALNENLHAILTKKRKLLVAKEVNNTLGKILVDVKMELMNNALSGNKESISWFIEPKKIGEKYGCVPRIKNKNSELIEQVN